MLSLVTVVRNEEARLPKMLEWHLPWVDEGVVVHDGPCADQSIEIARSHSCQVIVIPERVGYCEPLRAAGAAQVTGDWVLFVDADELFPIELLTVARQLARTASFDAVILPRVTEWTDNPSKAHAHDYQMRLLRRAKMQISSVIHTAPTTTGRPVVFEWPIRHYNLERDVPEKKGRYRSIIQEQLRQADPAVQAHLQRCLQEMDG